jgi:hypothetical protein
MFIFFLLKASASNEELVSAAWRLVMIIVPPDRQSSVRFGRACRRCFSGNDQR